METSEYTADTIWPISSCPGFLHEPRDPELAKLNYRLLFGKPWHSIRDVYGWLNHNSSCKHEVNQWILQKSRTRKGALDWESIRFHVDFDDLIKDLGKRMVRESDATTLAEALVAIENVTTTLSQALTVQEDELGELNSNELK